MKKLVLHTQYQENYGAHDWDGEGTCPQYWKNKGGSTYVFYGLTPKQEARIDRDGIPTLESLIEHDTDYSREYIRSMDFVDETEKVVDDWDSEIVMTYDREEGEWRCTVTREPHSPQEDIIEVCESWIMEHEGARKENSYTIRFLTHDGFWVDEEGLFEMRGMR